MDFWFLRIYLKFLDVNWLPYPPFKVMFAYIIYPDAMEEAHRYDIILVASYQR